MRSLWEKQNLYQGRLELRQEAQCGIDSVARGELIDLDTAMDAIREKMYQRYHKITNKHGALAQ